jgi:hypothetical protein
MRKKLRISSRILALTVLLAVAVSDTTALAADAVVVNQVVLGDATRRALEQGYGVVLPPGRYWYDTVSGAWGVEGGPVAGKILPGLGLGGPLRADASNGHTGVFVNGRELHPLDVAALQRCVAVVPGRYWLTADGVGGYEHAPPSFNLSALCSTAAGSQCEDYGNGQFNCSNPNTDIGIIGEGGGRAGVIVDGEVISTPN